jgi:hypothetical protein
VQAVAGDEERPEMRGFGDVHFGSVGFSLRRELLGAGVCETRKQRLRWVALVAQAFLPVPALKRGADRGCLACAGLRSFVVCPAQGANERSMCRTYGASENFGISVPSPSESVSRLNLAK